MKILFLLLLLVGCGSDSNPAPIAKAALPVSLSATSTNNNCTWWEIPQYYNGVPKYSGPMCTYTHKHIPVAVYGNGSVFYTTTDNATDDNFYIYAHKGEEKILVHQIDNWEDPHTNASIQIDNKGYVNVHVASRGLNAKFQSGKILKSKTPYQLDFECIDGCDNINFEAYPQVFDTSFGYYVGYTHYVKDPEIHASRDIREIWYRIGNIRTRIAKGAHYQNTYYHNGTIYVAFNYLKDAGADTRYNLYVIKTSDGFNWTTHDNKPVTLPLEQDDPLVRVYDSESLGNNVYLKDIAYKLGIRVLFTESTTKDPTDGERYLKEWWFDDGEQPVKTVTKTNHNYSSGAYVEYDNITYILTNGDSGIPYAGGGIELYKVFLGGYQLQDTLLDGNYSYIRKIYGVDGLAVSGEGFSDVFINSEHKIIEVK